MEQGSTGDSLFSAAVEGEFQALTEAMIMPRQNECLVCYVFRMLAYGCSGHHWLRRFRDTRAPRATALESRVERLGGYCDCEMIMNAFHPSPSPWYFYDEEGREVGERPDGEEKPACAGVRSNSTRHCSLWVAKNEFNRDYPF